MLFTPREYQRLIVDYIIENPRCCVFAGMGMGKTSASLYAFDALRMLGEANRMLVVAPRRVAIGTWPDEVRKWSNLGHLRIAAAVGTPAERLAALRSKTDVVTIDYENLKWLAANFDCNFDMIVSDESTRLKGLRVALLTSKKGKEYITGQGSSRAKSLAKMAFGDVKRWVNLTGSPAPNGLVDLWGQMFYIDRGVRLGRSFTAFSDRWFVKANQYGGTKPAKYAKPQIEAAIKDVCITVDPKDWFDIKEPIERVIKVTLPPAARKAYDELEKELFTEIETHEVEVFSAGSKSNKCLQIASGAVYTEHPKWIAVHDEKIEALKSIVAEANGEPILVSYQFIPDRDRILKAFPKARTLDQIKEKDWNAGKVPMLVVHPASAGHGLNLQDGGRILVDFSTGWNLEYDEQVIARIGPVRQLQSGHGRAVFRYRIIAADTLEELSVLPRIRSKASVQDSIKAAMKVRHEQGK